MPIAGQAQLAARGARPACLPRCTALPCTVHTAWGLPPCAGAEMVRKQGRSEVLRKCTVPQIVFTYFINKWVMCGSRATCCAHTRCWCGSPVCLCTLVALVRASAPPAPLPLQHAAQQQPPAASSALQRRSTRPYAAAASAHVAACVPVPSHSLHELPAGTGSGAWPASTWAPWPTRSCCTGRKTCG